MKATTALLAIVIWLLPASAPAVDDPFELSSLPTRGRTAAAEIVDVNGDGRADVVQVRFEAWPPDERRTLRVYLQDADGRIEREPDFERELPPGSAAYDLADVLPEPGVELLLLRADRLTALSLARADAPSRDLMVPGGSTLAPGQDERGLDRIPIADHTLGDEQEPWLLVPRLSEIVALSVDGAELARIDTGTRANFFARPRPGPLVVDSDMQLLLDLPRISSGDVDGDGRSDLVACGRHEVRVFLRREDGSFARQPSRVLLLRKVTQKDHIRASGSVAAEARDVDADGRLDLLVSHVSGGLTNAKVDTTLYLNRGGAWDLSNPDLARTNKGWGADQLLDFDGDGRLELLHVGIPFSVLEVVELLVTQEFDLRVDVYRSAPGEPFAKEPWLTRKLGVPFSFETSRPSGFVPNPNFDWNGDGQLDLLLSGDGDEIQVYLGGESRYGKRHARQELDSTGRLRPGDLDGDGLVDLLIYDPRRPDVPVLLGVNRGVLPGTLPRVGAGRPGATGQ